MPVEVYQALTLMISFVTLVVLILSFHKKNQATPANGKRPISMDNL
ncbi:putative holin-like toxin [Paenibacillus sp. FSL P2-0136]